MLLEALAWRQRRPAHGWFVAGPDMDPERAGRFRTNAATGKIRVTGVDRHGRAVMIFDNSRENTTSATDMIEYLAWNMELCYRTMDRSRSDKIMLLMHLTSFSIFNNPPSAVTKETIQILSGSFPESLGVCILLDAPGYFRAFYSMIKNFVDPKTLSKVIL